MSNETETVMVTFEDVLNYVAERASVTEVSALVRAGNNRVRVLRAIDAAKVSTVLTPGMKVELHGLKPKYLNGLTGEFVKALPGGNTAIVELDESCKYQAGRYGRTSITGAVELTGIPFSALRIVS